MGKRSGDFWWGSLLDLHDWCCLHQWLAGTCFAFLCEFLAKRRQVLQGCRLCQALCRMFSRVEFMRRSTVVPITPVSPSSLMLLSMQCWVSWWTRHDLYDTFLPQFETQARCVNVLQIMPAYSYSFVIPNDPSVEVSTPRSLLKEAPMPLTFSSSSLPLSRGMSMLFRSESVDGADLIWVWCLIMVVSNSYALGCESYS